MRHRNLFRWMWSTKTTIPVISLGFAILTSGCSSMVYSAKPDPTFKDSKVQVLTVTSSGSTTYGMAVTFAATAPVDLTGSVVFYDAEIAVGSAVLQAGSATFTTRSLRAGLHRITATWPGDANTEPITSPAITQSVSQAVPSIVWPTPSPITYGIALSPTQLNASSSGIAGAFTYNPSVGSLLPAGNQTLSVTFTPSDSVDYAVTTQTVELTVNKATPEINWSTPEALDYGISLSDVQLDASTSVAGSFAYLPAAGTLLDPGQHTLTVTFTPADSTDYNSVMIAVTQMIMQPTITVTAPAPAVLAGSTELFTARVTGAVNTNVEWEVNGMPGGNAQIGTIAAGGAYTAPEDLSTSATIGARLQALPAVQDSVQVQIVGPQSLPGSIGFAYKLPNKAATSAGVYDSAGKLVRTLWSNETFSAGAHSASWDGKDDAGSPAPGGSYEIRVLYNSVKYTWGVIADTSASWLAKNSWDQQNVLPKDMVAIGSTAYIANGYAEGTPNASSFSLPDPQEPEALFDAGVCIQAEYVATDGKLLYFANVTSGFSGSVPYVMAYDPTVHQYYNFPMGTTFRTPNQSICGNREPKSVIDYVASAMDGTTHPSPANAATGLAVQTHGTLLAVAHGAFGSAASLDVIRFFDKNSGAPVGSIQITNPQRLAFDKSGDLWAISDKSVVLISTDGNKSTIVRELPGLSAPLAIAVDPTNNDILVSDGGSAQQVKRFSASGQFLSAYGDLGGYTDCDPRVTKRRLFLDTTAGDFNATRTGSGGGAFLAALTDGSYWVGDPGDARVLHISSTGKYIEQIAFLRYLYQVTADHGDPSRIFANDLEYHVDYSKPLLPADPDPQLGGNGSWSLVKNWAACRPPNFAPFFTQVQTFSNGRTYAAVENGNVSPAHIPELVELPASGPLRFSGRLLRFGDSSISARAEAFSHNGDLAYWTVVYNPQSGHTWYARQQDLLGYGDDGWPQWGDSRVIASFSASNIADPVGTNGWGMVWWPEATIGGFLATFRTHPSSAAENHHLGAVRLGGTTWSWKASPGASIKTPDGKGTFPDISSYGGHDGIAALVEGAYIIEGYDGQYGTFSSQWMLWSQDGLLLGQFGHPAHGLASDGTKFPEAAGNIKTMSTVMANGNIYLYNSDESYHLGIHRWEISNLESVHEVVGTAAVGSTVMLH